MKQIAIIAALILALCEAYGQAGRYPLNRLEKAPDSTNIWVIGSDSIANAKWVKSDTSTINELVEILNPTDTTLNFLNTKGGVVEVVWSVEDFIITGDMTPTFYRVGDTLCITNGADNMWSCVDVREFESLDVSEHDEAVLNGVDQWSPSVTEFKSEEKNHTLTMNGVVMKKVVTPTHINEYSITGSTIQFYENLDNDRVVYRSN